MSKQSLTFGDIEIEKKINFITMKIFFLRYSY